MSFREIACATLERTGYKVFVAASGAEAVATYARNPDLAVALIDMTMPVMDGVSTIVALRQFNPSLRIIASSGILSANSTTRPITAGAHSFIAKL